MKNGEFLQTRTRRWLLAFGTMGLLFMLLAYLDRGASSATAAPANTNTTLSAPASNTLAAAVRR